jgi:hypothetical protein
MPNIRERNLAAFWARYERDDVRGMTPEHWGEWVNALPLPEFMAMVSLRQPEPRRTRRQKKPLSPKRKALCMRLVGIAAFHVSDPDAQKAVYAAVRELQR